MSLILTPAILSQAYQLANFLFLCRPKTKTEIAR